MVALNDDSPGFTFDDISARTTVGIFLRQAACRGNAPFLHHPVGDA